MTRADGGREPGGRGGGEPYRVMVVDDSAVVRGLVTRFIEQDPEMRVVASVGNGQRAIEALQRHETDVVVLDIEMPVMDGLTALPKLLRAQPGVQVIMASTLTKANADVSIRALNAGAADYVAKPSTGGLHSKADFQEELRSKVKALGAARRKAAASPPLASARDVRSRPGVNVSKPKPVVASAGKATVRRAPPDLPPQVIAIGSSTGGPQALFQLLGALDPVSQPILITQHMPATFTALLAEHIARQTSMPCSEAKDGEPLVGGKIYVAPGGHHMLAERRGGGLYLRLSDAPPENFCRPSVDPMLRSLVDVYGSRILAVILTGMGSDGCKGCGVVVEAGGHVIAQDEETSVVWGMPGAVTRAGLVSAVLPLAEIAPKIRKIAVRSAA